MWVALGVGVCRVFFDVAYMSIVVSLVPKTQLTEANSRLQATLEVANIAGPSAGGFLAKVISAPILPLASVIGFLSSAFAIWRIPEPPVTQVRRRPGTCGARSGRAWTSCGTSRSSGRWSSRR